MPRVSKALQQAIDALSLRDIYLARSSSACSEDFEPKYNKNLDELEVQRMHVVVESAALSLDDQAQTDQEQLLRITIRLGTRWVDNPKPQENEAPQEAEVKAFIEADFVVEYQLKQELPQNAIDEFAAKNASYHVWPYWREFMASTTERMRLPRVILPMVQFAK